MSKLKRFLFGQEEIQIAIAAGFCILLLAYVSRWILHTEFSYLDHAIPGLVALVFEVLKKSRIDVRFQKCLKPVYGVLAILASAVFVILKHI